ncbi:hypothetical protein EZV62_009656 [Acer yangbiense]|uniref:BAG domain-containing protein n=1 Tax=Acer yangbiense TaxID=1000413 RepID=A0A5C7I2L6_9ROSI|nr:hypothetical protein EZV62_009656 [Acer yangbiense]
MSFYRELDAFDDPYPPFFGFHSFPEEPLHLFHHHDYDHFYAHSHSSPFEVLDAFSDLNRFDRTPFPPCYRRIGLKPNPDPFVRSLHDEVSRLESKFHRILGATKVKEAERKYSWKTKIKSPDYMGPERKYEWTAKIKHGNDRKYKWKAEIKGDGSCMQYWNDRRCKWMADVENGVDRKYGWKAKIKRGDSPKYKWTAEVDHGFDNKYKWTGGIKGGNQSHACTKGSSSVRVMEVEDPIDQRTAYRRQATKKRATVVANAKGKRKELSAQEAATMIQHNFREYMTRRSQSVRSLRELVVAKAKLREIKALFNNYPYRHRIARDTEERQRFSERIIVLLLAVDAIEGGDFMVRASKRLMQNELDAMLDVVEPRPQGKQLGSMRRRKFDLPGGCCNQNEIAAGVAEVVQMLDQADKYDKVSL